MADPIIELRGVTKRFAPGADAVRGLSFALAQGRFMALLGASGCGKTTTLRLIAGLEQPDEGEIWLNGARVSGGGKSTPPEQRRVGMVFQDYALFPHLTIAQNVAFAINRWPAPERDARVEELLRMTGLAGLGRRYPHELSGGQQQRVALARALAAKPSIVLLDEPFSNLDAALRSAMREDVREILRAAGATAIFVTHDQEEALSITDVVGVMSAGRMLQLGSPHDVYLRPTSREVASFVGEANFLPGRAAGQIVDCALGKLLLAAPAHGPVDVMVRPEALRLVPEAASSATLDRITFYGHDQAASVRFDDGLTLRVRMIPRPDLAANMRVRVVVQGPVVAYPTA